MNFSQSSDTDYKPSRGRHASAAQQNNNIFGFESNQIGQDQMFPPNRVKASADEEMAQRQAAQANYERRMEEALNNRKHGQTATNIFSQDGPDVSKYSYKASQPQQNNGRQQPISNVFENENNQQLENQQQDYMSQYQEPVQQYQQPQAMPNRQYSDIFNQQQNGEQIQPNSAHQYDNINQRQSDIFNQQQNGEQIRQHSAHQYNNINQRQSDIFNQNGQQIQQSSAHQYNNINQRQSDIFHQQNQPSQQQPNSAHQYSNNQRQSNIFNQNAAPERPPSHKKTYQQTRQGFNPITGKWKMNSG